MTGDQAFRVLLRMRAVAGGEGRFESTWLEIGALVASQPGNLGQWLMRSHEEPGVFYIISDWVDEALFRDFERGDLNARNRDRLRAVRADVSMTTMQVVRFLPGAAARPAESAPRSSAAGLEEETV